MRLVGLLPFMGYFWITAASEEMLVITASEYANVSLKCTAQMKPGVDYRAVRWYKETVAPRLTGLVSKTPPGGMLRWYVDADTRISLEYPSLSLLLPPVSCSDSGVYQCYLAAPVGEQNREGRVRLSVTGCSTTEPPIRTTDTTTGVGWVACFFPEYYEQYDERNDRPTDRPTVGPTDGYLIICGAVAVLILALMVFFLSYRSLKNALWQQTKTLGKEPYPDPNSLPEKQDLLWITTLGHSPKKSEITAA